MGEKGGAMVRALASLQCGPGVKSNAICGLNLLLVLFLAEIIFSGYSGFPLAKIGTSLLFRVFKCGIQLSFGEISCGISLLFGDI